MPDFRRVIVGLKHSKIHVLLNSSIKKKIFVTGNGYHMDYNDELPTTTLNSVGNAVLQFIPSLLPGKLELFSPDGGKTGEIQINSTYWAPFAAHNSATVQQLVMGLISGRAQKVDLNMAPGTKHCKNKI